jgi:hypothetical protein
MATELHLQNNFQDLAAREALNAAQLQLAEIRHTRLEKQFNEQSAKWTRVGDRCNAEFFAHHSTRHCKVRIRELNNNSKILTW